MALYRSDLFVVDVLELIPDNVESNIFYDTLLARLPENKVQIFPIKARWYETGNPTDYFAATKDVLEKLDSETHQFINQYDESRLIKNDKTLSLVSNAADVDAKNFLGINVISKSVAVLKKKLVKDSVLFDQTVLNADYFKTN